jgi:hypothetical protein
MTDAAASAPPAYTATPVDELCNRFVGKINPDTGEVGVDWNLVYPPMQRKYREALLFCQLEQAEFYATCGTRSYGGQTKLFLKGRRTPGPHAGEVNYPALGLSVTKARAGESSHNFGIAIDSTRDGDLHRIGLQPDFNIAHYEVLARAGKRVGLHSLFYDPEFREGPHLELDLEAKGLTRNLLRIEFEKRGLFDTKAGLADVFLFLDRFGPW